ncbi:ABC-F family ATP-binding cassette domain-containing protein [soil metagenome]
MSAQLVVRDLSAGHGPRVLFSGLDLVVAPGDVVGLVGPKGAGKSTMLRLLAGLAQPLDGSRQLAPPDATVGLLPQETERVPGETLLDFLGRRTGVTAAQSARDLAAQTLADGGDTSGEIYSVALEHWLALGAADMSDRAGAVTDEVGLDVGLDQQMSSLSGGQAARAGLASLLLSRYDVLLLDEPTNDLDLAGLEQLERFVTGSDAGVVVISHDREFLARTVTKVLELDMHQHSVNLYGGGFDAYLVERERARQHAREEDEEYADTLSGLKERGRTQRAWGDKGARAARKNPVDNDKFVRNWAISSSEKQASKAKQTDRMIERLDKVEEPRKEWELQLSIAGAPPSGRVVAVLGAAVVQRGSFTFGPATLQIDRGDRVAITGPNGSGKSTLLALLLGTLTPDSGTASLGSGVRVGAIDQVRAAFLGDESLIDAFCAEVPDMLISEVRTLLAKFGLGGDHVGRPATTLSPGERTRAGLALLQARGVNLLVLDEPTNHLDLPAIEQLESALEAFDATILLVTHDRRLLETVRLTRRFAVEDGAVTEI